MALMSSVVHCQRHYGRALSRSLLVSYKLQDHVLAGPNLSRNLSHCCAPSPVLQRKISGQHIQVMTKRHESMLLHDVLADWVEGYFQILHGSLGLEWWAAIAITVIPVRLLISAAVARKTNEKIMVLREVTEKEMASKDIIRAELNKDRRLLHKKGIKTEADLEKLVIRKTLRNIRQKHKEHGCSPSIIASLMLVPIPFWILITSTLRRMSGGNLLWLFEPGPVEESLATGGCLWFPDFLALDPFHVMPITAALTFLTSLEVAAALSGQDKLTYRYKILKVLPIVLRIFIISFPYLTWNMPSAILFYWNISALTALAFTLGAIHPKIKILLLKVEHQPSATPYRDLVVLLKQRYKNMWKDITTFAGKIGSPTSFFK